ncbi:MULTISPECIES: DUF2171 domain-containing protein [unclassified Devosia]|uniref:DUF2171 domain-containing protein n=1 Tax=unclassified Devosia TaxID=196773 RepID=UPI0015523D79|nr:MULTISPECIES: DUF2171 domain-containing protein [unclassified Devosia]
MSDLSTIAKGMTVVGADGVKVGLVADVAGSRIKLESVVVDNNAVPSLYIPGGLVAHIEGDVVRLTATGANVMLFDEQEDGTLAD